MLLTVQGYEIPYLEDQSVLARVSPIWRQVVVAERQDVLLVPDVSHVLLEEFDFMVDLELRLDLHLFHEVEVLLLIDLSISSCIGYDVGPQEEEEVVQVKHAVDVDVFEAFRDKAVVRRLVSRGKLLGLEELDFLHLC